MPESNNVSCFSTVARLKNSPRTPKEALISGI